PVTNRSAADSMVHNGTPISSFGGSQTVNQALQTANAISVAAANHQTSAGTGKHALPITPVAAPAMTVQNMAGMVHGIKPGQFMTSVHLSNAATPPVLLYSHLVGALGEAGLNGIAKDATGNSYVAGYADLTGSGKIVGLVAKTDPTGAILWVDGVTEMNPAPDKMYGLALDATASTLYAAGALDNGTGTTDGVVLALDTSTGAGTGGYMIASGAMTGVTVDVPGNVYADGYLTDGSGALLAVKTDGALSLPPIYATGITVAGSPLITTSSQSIAVDVGGNVGLTGQLQDPSGDFSGLTASLDSTGSFIPYAFTWINPTPGPGGAVNGIIYGGGSFYEAGTLNAGDGSTQLSKDLILAKLDSVSGAITWGFDWYVDDRTPLAARVGDWTGDGIGLTGAAGDNPVVTGGAIDPVQYPPLDPPTAGVDVTVTHFGAAGNTTMLHTDGDPENCFGGSADDYGRGLVVSAGVAYTVGATASADFPTTDGSTYGGGPTDGFGTTLAV
ncbi:MAG TPA: hypothetical protein VGY77_11880, partial [Gemmataceae bacterium]|nr:hypothetical protein [Gemmataceae bacterium]